MYSPRVAIGLLLFGAAVMNSYAVDGLVLIDQSRALAGSVTAGDTPGFPITISQPGSYRLSGNLTVPSGQRAIVIAAANVSIDMNGFNITTPVQSPGGGAIAIVSDGATAPTAFAIRNGRIQGFVTPFGLGVNSAGGFMACRYCVFEEMNLNWGYPGGASSIDLGQYTRVRNVTAPLHDFNVYCPSLITGSVVRSANMAIDFPGDADINAGVCTFQQNATN
jgi:hypothetical protein